MLLRSVRTSTRICLLIALAAAGSFYLAARAVERPPVAQYGGALWVFLLTLLITLPLLTPLIRRRVVGQP